MTRNFKILLGLTVLVTIWFLASSNYVWQFPILRTVFITIGNGAVTVAKLKIPEGASWQFLGFNSAGWDWTWDFQNHSVVDLWRIRLPLWPLVFGLISLVFWNWYRLVFRRPYLCSKCAFDLRGTVGNLAKLCNECGTPWNSDFLAAQTGASAAAWTGPTYHLLRKNAKQRFFIFIAAIVLSLVSSMLLVSSYASPQGLVLGDTTLSVSRFVFWITHSVNDSRLVDSGIDRPNTARQIITTYQTMPNGSYLVTIPLWPVIAGIAALLWLAHRRWLVTHKNLKGES